MKKLSKKEILDKLVPPKYCGEFSYSGLSSRCIYFSIGYSHKLGFKCIHKKRFFKSKQKNEKIISPDWCPL
tara:strand:+ start:2183 stop:2395 length:213 start_codon:yes stop_codon:yes gene_type:complete